MKTTFKRISSEAFELSNDKLILICLYSERNNTVFISAYKSRTEEPVSTFYMDASDCLAAVQLAASTLESIDD